jgi:hypothetical protein
MSVHDAQREVHNALAFGPSSRETERQRDRETERQRDRERQRETEREERQAITCHTPESGPQRRELASGKAAHPLCQMTEHPIQDQGQFPTQTIWWPACLLCWTSTVTKRTRLSGRFGAKVRDNEQSALLDSNGNSVNPRPDVYATRDVLHTTSDCGSHPDTPFACLHSQCMVCLLLLLVSCIFALATNRKMGLLKNAPFSVLFRVTTSVATVACARRRDASNALLLLNKLLQHQGGVVA